MSASPEAPDDLQPEARNSGDQDSDVSRAREDGNVSDVSDVRGDQQNANATGNQPKSPFLTIDVLSASVADMKLEVTVMKRNEKGYRKARRRLESLVRVKEAEAAIT